jgi:hypothetical protein
LLCRIVSFYILLFTWHGGGTGFGLCLSSFLDLMGKTGPGFSPI